MLSFLSTRQRAVLILALMAGAQACVVAGLTLGWAPAATIGGSATCAVFAALAFLGGTSAISGFLSSFSAHAQRIAAGDLSTDVEITGAADAAQALRSLQALQDELRRSISAIRNGADGVTVAASEIATGNADLSARTEQTASNLQLAASSMAQLNATVRQSADSAAQANQLASSAAAVAQRGGEVVAQVVSTMDEINTSSKKISDIIGVIDGIAFQTNILALNAAVEAARAGEQGRGFAVVAGEVRSLAQRSAEAAREIKTLIGTSVDKVETGARLVQDAGSTMGEIVSSVQRVSDIIGEISAAATEQSAGIGQVNGSVVQLDQMTQQNAALVEESAAAAESLKDQAGRLAGAVSSFRLGDNGPAAAPSFSAAPAPKPVAHKPAVHKPAAPKAAASTAKAPAASFKPAAAPARPATPAASASRPAAAAPKAAGAPARPAAAATEDAGSDWETF